MPKYTILYDEPQEAVWFRQLHDSLADAEEFALDDAMHIPRVAALLAYDRPDIVLLADGEPILVLEETVEVPSGHNVGQRFARLAAAAEEQVPALYFGPYVAKKHGGRTAGPRYMNVRLFHALDSVTRLTQSSITTVNWGVDHNHEILKGKSKDNDVREFINTLLDEHSRYGATPDLPAAIAKSAVHERLLEERSAFVRDVITDPEQYDEPPDSVERLTPKQFTKLYGVELPDPLNKAESIYVYQVGMRKLRADPYTGMGLLYRYLYIAENSVRALVLWFPHISIASWRAKAKRKVKGKEVRLYPLAADAILFADGLVLRDDL